LYLEQAKAHTWYTVWRKRMQVSFRDVPAVDGCQEVTVTATQPNADAADLHCLFADNCVNEDSGCTKPCFCTDQRPADG